MVEPIIIMGMPRAGTSMTAGIFAQHGVWTGTCRKGNNLNAKGFFENQPIKNYMVEMFGRVCDDAVPVRAVPLRDHIECLRDADGYDGGPWLWKGSAMYYPTFFEFNPTWIVCRRSSPQIFNSMRASRVFGKEHDDNRLVEIIEIHQMAMDRLVDMGAFEVLTEEVAAGHFLSIHTAIKGAGLEYDESLVREFVDADLWHYES